MENGLNALFTQPKVATKTSLGQLVDDKSIWKFSTDSWQVMVKTSTNLQITSCNRLLLKQGMGNRGKGIEERGMENEEW